MKVEINVNVNLEELKEILTGTDELQQWVRTSIDDLRNWVMDMQEYGRDYGTPAGCPSETPEEPAPSAEAAPTQKNQSAEKTAPAAAATPTTAASKTAPADITLEMVRATLAALVQSDKQEQVKELIEKYGGSKLSDIPPQNYPGLLAEAEGM